jgi:PAS domain S-box-containing protein
LKIYSKKTSREKIKENKREQERTRENKREQESKTKGISKLMFINLKIGTKLAINFLIVSFLSMAAIGLLSFNNAKNNLAENVQANLINLVEAHALQIDMHIYSVMGHILTLAQADILAGADFLEMDRYLGEIAEINPFFESFIFLDLDGKILAASNEAWKRGDRLQEDDALELFEKVKIVKGKDVLINDMYLMPNLNELETEIAAPVRDRTNTKVIGVLYGSFRPVLIHQIVQSLNDRTEGSEDSFLVNKHGIVLSMGENKSEIFKKYRHHTKPHLTDALAGHVGFEVYYDDLVHQEVELAAYAPLKGFKTFKGLGWSLITVEPAEVAFASVSKLKNAILLVGLIIAVIVLLLVGLLARTISQPIVHLSGVSRQISEGNLAARAIVSSRDEIGDLARFFNVMIDDLQQSRNELVAAKDYTDNIIQSMVDTLIVVNPDATIRTVNQAILDLLGYTEQELIGKPIGRILAEEEEEEALFKGTRLDKLIQEGAVKDYELTYRTKGGERIPVSFSGSVMYEETKDQGPRGDHGPSTMDRKKMVNGQWSLVTSPAKQIVGIVGVAKDMRAMRRLMQKEKDLAAAAAAAEEERKKARELKRAYKQLDEKTNKLERFQKVAIRSVMDTLPFKEEVNALLTQLGQPKKYRAVDKIKERRDKKMEDNT